MKSPRIALLVLAAVAAGYFYTVNQAKAPNAADPDRVLAAVGKSRLTQLGLSTQDVISLQSYDEKRFRVLDGAARKWADQIVLAKEAKARKTTPEDLLDKNVFSKSAVTEAEIMSVYAASPAASKMPYVKALKSIHSALEGPRLEKARARYFGPLYEKYRVRFFVERPDSYSVETKLRGGKLLRPFAMPPAKPELFASTPDALARVSVAFVALKRRTRPPAFRVMFPSLSVCV